MDLRPWAYWAPDGKPYPGTNEAVAVLESVLARKPKHPGRQPLLHPRHGGDEEPGAGRGRGRSPAHPDAGRGPHGPHARPHLHAGGTLRGRVGRERGGDRRGRGLHHPVPRPGHLSRSGYYPHNIHFLWSASTHGRPERDRDRGRPQGGGAGHRREHGPAPAPRRAFASCPTTPSPASDAGTRC